MKLSKRKLVKIFSTFIIISATLISGKIEIISQSLADSFANTQLFRVGIEVIFLPGRKTVYKHLDDDQYYVKFVEGKAHVISTVREEKTVEEHEFHTNTEERPEEQQPTYLILENNALILRTTDISTAEEIELELEFIHGNLESYVSGEQVVMKIKNDALTKFSKMHMDAVIPNIESRGAHVSNCQSYYRGNLKYLILKNDSIVEETNDGEFAFGFFCKARMVTPIS